MKHNSLKWAYEDALDLLRLTNDLYIGCGCINVRMERVVLEMEHVCNLLCELYLDSVECPF